MRRPPITVYVLTLAAIGLIVLMTLEALHGRVYGVFPEAKGWYWGAAANLAQWLSNILSCADCLTAEALSWPILVIGLSWIGALVAFWLRLSWTVRSILILGVFSLAFWMSGTVLTLMVFLSLWLKPTRTWFSSAHE